MRLLYVIDSLAANGGAEQALVGMLPHWVAYGTNVHVATLVERPGLEAMATAAGAQLHQATGSRLQRVQHLRHLIRRIRPDLVHTTLFESDIAGRLAGVAAGVPVVTSLVNTPYGPEHRRDPTLRPSRLLAAQVADAASARAVRAFHALTEHVAATMSTRLLVPRARMTVIPRGRDAALLGSRTAARRQVARQQLGVDPRDRLVLAASRQEHQKGLDVLVEAMARLPRSDSAILLIAGRTGAATPLLQELVTRRGMKASVRFLGVRTDVADLMCAADVFALPSRWEGLGSVLVEAMCLGVPVVASDVPAVRETLGHEGRSALVIPDDADALARGLSRALSRTSHVQGTTSALRERFFRHYTVQRVAAAMVAFHNSAARSG